MYSTPSPTSTSSVPVPVPSSAGRHRLLSIVVLVAACWLAAVPAFGYVIFLKSGQQIQAQEKYEVRGEMAIITLRSGTTSQIPLAQIDVEKTERLNEEMTLDAGTQLLEGVGPPPGDAAADLPQEQRLSAAIAARRQQAASGPSTDLGVEGAEGADNLPRTSAGFIDLAGLPRFPYEDTAIGAELRAFLSGQGIEEVAVFEGTGVTTPLIEIITGSEEGVFKALEASANALVQMRQTYPDEVEAFEILMLTPSQERAAQFYLSADRADELLNGKLKQTEFFIRYVEF